ncbi:hypothetical protein M514_00008 [Trichuris suis]|uniref:Uncharacterized protein n=1 Tax=Trichuris suis TaxID=68888 RepID=A0A085NTR0_9BILA|nr:hypothetical protein M513_00008 [Trichuris suis]KFD72856.1 hypothetical protein M514_00008 [Trichuris suis]
MVEVLDGNNRKQNVMAFNGLFPFLPFWRHEISTSWVLRSTWNRGTFKISILRNMRPIDVPPYSTLRSIRRFDKFAISTVQDVIPSNLSTHIAFRTVRELGPFEILKRSRAESSERRLQENNRELRSR